MAHEIGNSSFALSNKEITSHEGVNGSIKKMENQETLEHVLSIIGSNIKNYRAERKMSQKELANSSGLDRAYISSLESGKQNLTIGAMIKLAGALQVQLDDLMRKHA